MLCYVMFIALYCVVLHAFYHNMFCYVISFHALLCSTRLVLFWENVRNGRNTISTAAVRLTRQRYTRSVGEWYNCPTQKEVRTPVATYMSESGSHYMLWQEKTNRLWSIGGYKLQGNMNHRNRKQRQPAVVYNTRRSKVLVVFQEVIDGQNVFLFGQHVSRATGFSCKTRCGLNEKCAQQDVCISKQSSTFLCSKKPFLAMRNNNLDKIYMRY